MTTLALTLGGIAEPIAALGATVEVAQTIGNWYAAPYLHCTSLQLRTGGQDSVATLVEHAGQIHPALAHGSQPHYPSERPLHFVRVTVEFHDGTPDFVWVGIITSQTDEIAAKQGTTEHRNQTYIAHGIEWMLHRELVTKSRIRSETTASYWIGRAVPFNGGHGRGGSSTGLHSANRTTTADGSGLHAFAQSITDASYWTAWDILEYLQEWWQPFSGMVWGFGAGVQAATEWYTPLNFEVHGQSIREIISKLINRSRTMDHYWEWNNGTGQLLLTVQTHATAAITLPSGGTIPANTQRITINADTRQRSPISVARTYATRWDQIIVEGDLITSTFPIQVSSNSLVRDWTDAHEMAYCTACQDMAGYAALDKDAKAARNDLFRMQGDARKAYTRLRIPSTWNLSTESNEWAFPRVRTDGTTIDTAGPSATWINGLRLNLQTLLPEIDAGEVVGSEFEYENGMVFIQVPITHRGVSSTIYSKLSDLASLAKSETAGVNGISFSVQVRSYDTGPGLFVEPSVPAKVLALGATTETDQPGEHKPVLDWQTIIAVVTVEGDDYVRVAYPATPSLTGGQVAKHTIKLAGGARLDYIPAGTPTHIDETGQLTVTDNNGFLRDDREYMMDVARMAYEWYQVERQLVRFSVPYFLGSIVPADLITVIDNMPINTLVTAITYDFTSTSTTIETSGAEEIDFSMWAKA